MYVKTFILNERSLKKNYYNTNYNYSNYNTNLSAKYKDKSAKDLKRILKVLKRSGDEIEEIKFVSRKLQARRQLNWNGGAW